MSCSHERGACALLGLRVHSLILLGSSSPLAIPLLLGVQEQGLPWNDPLLSLPAINEGLQSAASTLSDVAEETQKALPGALTVLAAAGATVAFVAEVSPWPGLGSRGQAQRSVPRVIGSWRQQLGCLQLT